jgi:hypothetical protein
MSRFRLFIAFASAVALATVSTAAHAGTYTVRSCWSNGSGSDSCNVVGSRIGAETMSIPTPPPWGIGTAHTSNEAVFAAPPDTRVVAFAGNVEVVSRLDPGIGSWWIGLWDEDTGATVSGLPPFTGHLTVQNLSVSRLALGLRCFDHPCPLWTGSPPPSTQSLYAWNMEITIGDDRPPALTVSNSAPDGWLRDEVVAVSASATDNVGVGQQWITADNATIAADVRGCDTGKNNVLARPCAQPPSPITADLDTHRLGDGVHTVTITAVDVARNTTSQVIRLMVDSKTPGAPRALRLAGAQTWRPENRFDVSWVNPQSDGLSPLEAVEYELCPAANPPDDDSGCVRGNRNGRNLERIPDLTVPRSGEWRLRVALRDGAGNLDWNASGVLEPLRLDAEVPTAAFLPFDAFDPTRVQLAATDDVSGVASVEIEARREGDSAWHALSVEGSGSRYSALLDDSQLIDGMYELRAHIVDKAGNERTTAQFAGGAAAQIRLPVRTATAIAVGQPKVIKVTGSKGKRPKTRRVLVRQPVARYGEPVAIEGTLADPAGNPRVGVTVQVLERVDVPGRDWQHLADVRTDASGRFVFRALPGPARVLRFAYPGSATTRPRSEDVELRVRAGVSITPSRPRVRNGERVVFRGRILGGPIPAAGKLLALQARTSRGWRTFATPRARASDGRWSAEYRFLTTPVTTRYAFRVVVPEESSYPYASGVSKVAHVLVRGGS